MEFYCRSEMGFQTRSNHGLQLRKNGWEVIELEQSPRSGRTKFGTKISAEHSANVQCVIPMIRLYHWNVSECSAQGCPKDKCRQWVDYISLWKDRIRQGLSGEATSLNNRKKYLKLWLRKGLDCNTMKKACPEIIQNMWKICREELIGKYMD